MLKTILATFIALFISLLVFNSSNVLGQASNTQLKASLAGLGVKLDHSFSADGSAVEVILVEHVLTVSRLNSYLNDGSHVDRNNEAVSIVSLIQSEASGNPDFKDVLIIRVHYILNAKGSAERKVIDRIEFRKNQGGVFEFHST